MASSTPASISILVTAGPTHEPIDAVRYLANRSSGRLGIALAQQAALVHRVTLALGPVCLRPRPSQNLTVAPFRTTADLQMLLSSEMPRHDVLIMAAAVADYRPIAAHTQTKTRRDARGMTLALQATPDLVAQCVERRLPGQCLIGFALEPVDRLETSALEKLERKGIDAIIANPIDTMDSELINAFVLLRSGRRLTPDGPMSKPRFAQWLMTQLDAIRFQAGR